MKRILLVDIENKPTAKFPGKIQNLALTQSSSWFKSQGDIVGFNVTDPDIVFASVIFSGNKHLTDGLQLMYPNAKIIIGGSGSGNLQWLPEEMQKVRPDYSLYPAEMYSLGFTTRGCIRNCPFCIVRKKEGCYRRWQHIDEFHNPEYDRVVILDNNWYADKDWFFENSQYLIDNNLAVNVSQGMDLRILTQEIAERLKQLKWFGKNKGPRTGGTLRFAWDNINDEKAVMKGLQTLQDAGINIRNRVQVYVLIDFDTTLEQDLYRVNKLKHTVFDGQSHTRTLKGTQRWGTSAFLMQYQQIDKTFRLPLYNPHSPHMARWANRKWAYWSTDFEDYETKAWGPLRKSNKNKTLKEKFE